MTLQGCGNEFKETYYGSTLQQVRALAPDMVHTASEPIIKQIDLSIPLKKYVDDAFAEGYNYLGQSDFTDLEDSYGATEVLEQAKECGAHLALWGTSHESTQTRDMPVTTYNQGTTSTTYNKIKIGTKEYKSKSTTYTPATTSTTYMPVLVNINNFVALYFYKFTPVLGLLFDEIPNEDKRIYDTNSGLYVRSVTKDAIAYNAKIFPGDIILEINGKPVHKDFNLPRGKVTLKIGRNGTIIKKILNIPEKNGSLVRKDFNTESGQTRYKIGKSAAVIEKLSYIY